MGEEGEGDGGSEERRGNAKKRETEKKRVKGKENDRKMIKMLQ